MSEALSLAPTHPRPPGTPALSQAGARARVNRNALKL
jgi:hypothetical protein